MGVFGRAIRDLYHRRSRGAFFACEGERETPVDPAFYLNDTPSALERDLLRHAKGRCLDIGCGAGRTLLALERMGLPAVGIDTDADLVALCHERALADVYERSWRDAPSLGVFDTILMLNHSIGMAGSADGTRALLATCRACAAPDAVLLFDSRDIATEEAPDGSGIVVRQLRDKYAGEYGQAFEWVAFSRPAIAPLLTATGWRLDKTATGGGKYGMVCRAQDLGT